ncbi:MAG TPA: LD-carboxypeptidase [Rhizomicrobium sp.]|jgi:muramoyltetrapeptide carboxypeptidase|nr:LD-carboxypeptidase [Rhizomicrobium sp.]
MSAVRIGIVAPGSRIDTTLAERVSTLAAGLYGDRVALRFHPQCFLSHGHFAGDDAARAGAFLDFANDPQIDSLWIARGGYGACRIVPAVLAGLAPAAMGKTFLGYSDAGSLLAALYGRGMTGVAHGPMPADILREGGEPAIARALRWLVERAPSALDPSVSGTSLTAAFNLTILSHLVGTPFEPDLANHVIMLEEVSEHLYRIDRALCQVTGNPGIRKAAGLRLGRVSAVPPNDPDFGQTPEEIIRHWCAQSGIPFLGPADIGHDVENKVVPFGMLL